MNIQELIQSYKKNQEDQALKNIYDELNMLTHRIASSYWGLTDADLSSFAYETLYLCLKTYRIDGGSKFTSYYATSLKFKLRAETIALHQQKRKANYCCDSYEELQESGFDISNQTTHDIYIIDAINSMSLTNNERKYCMLLINDEYSNAEIAKKLNVSIMTLCNLRKSLKIKLKDYFITQ